MPENIFSKKDFDSIDNLEQFYSILQDLKPTISFFAQRKFSYQNSISFSMNDIIRKFVSLAKVILERNQNHLTTEQQLQIACVNSKILCLNNKCYILFNKAYTLTKVFAVFSIIFNSLYAPKILNEIIRPSKLEELLLCENCMSLGDPKFAMLGLKGLGIDPLEKKGFEIWKSTIDLCPPEYILKVVGLLRTIGVDPLNNSQLQTYIGLLQRCHKIQALDFSNIDINLGLEINTLQELKTLTLIISALSVKGEENKNVWKFLEAKRINGIIPVEQEYFQWLVDVTIVPWNGKEKSSLEKLPLKLLKAITDKLDLKSHVTLLSALRTPKTTLQNAVWLSLLKQDRSKIPKHGDISDVINLMSPLSILKNVHLFGKSIKQLDLTGIFYFDSHAKEKREGQLKVLRVALKSCSKLEILIMKSSGTIDNGVMSCFPETLRKLYMDGCNIVSLEIIPKKVREVRTGTLELNPPVIIPFLKTLYIENTTLNTNLSYLKGYENLQGFVVDILQSKEQFKKLCSFLPVNLRILKIGSISNLISDNILTDNEFYGCMEQLSKNCRKLSHIQMPVVLVKLGSSTIGRLSQYKHLQALGCVWNEQFKELFRLIPSNISSLAIRPKNHKFIDDDINDLPITLKKLIMGKINAQLSEAAQKTLKDQGVTIELI